MNDETILSILDPYLEDYKQGRPLTHRALYALFDQLTTEEWCAVERILAEEHMELEEYCSGVLEYELLIDDSEEAEGADLPIRRRAAEEDLDQDEEVDRDQAETEYLMEEELKELLVEVLEELPEQEATVIRMHYGLEGYPKHSLEAIAEELELDLEGVCSLESKALTRLKGADIRSQLEDYKNFSK